jgi:hypothetical protein
MEPVEDDDPRAVYFDPENIVKPDLNDMPWPKACNECAFRAGDPQHLGADLLAMLKTDVIDGEVDFYCVHRVTNRNCHRLCASAAALRSAQCS